MNYDTIYNSMIQHGMIKEAAPRIRLPNNISNILNKLRPNDSLKKLFGSSKAIDPSVSKAVKSKLLSTSGGSPFPGWNNPSVYGLGKQPHTLSPSELNGIAKYRNPLSNRGHKNMMSAGTRYQYDSIRKALEEMDYANLRNGSSKASAIARLLSPSYEMHMIAGTPQQLRGKGALRASDIRGRHYKTIAEMLGEDKSVIDRISDVTKARKVGIAPWDDFSRSKVDELWRTRSPKLRTFLDLATKNGLVI